MIQVGQLVGVWPTVGLVVLTGFAGAALARLEGLRTLWKLRTELARGRLPGEAVMDGLAILVGGALLLTPGILTDLLGFSFLLPPTRKALLGRVRNVLEKRLKSGAIRFTHMGGFSLGGTGVWGGGPGDAGSAEKERKEGGPSPWKTTELDPSGEIVIEAEESMDP